MKQRRDDELTAEADELKPLLGPTEIAKCLGVSPALARDHVTKDAADSRRQSWPVASFPLSM
ncbi:MAG TPA: hypothetical protein VHZ07_14415 [Bryobacteraceae bacterium]|nr:hypothetical protein [Bryobacteraceae bacterium]